MSEKRKKNKELVEERVLLDAAGIESALDRLAGEILRRNDSRKLFLVGIRTGGVYLAQRMQERILSSARYEVPLGVMDITLYRDDIVEGLPRPDVGPTELPSELEGKNVILIDDVLFTGRTVRSALVELMDFGRPESIQLCVLVDRGHRELPIHADFVGLKIETQRDQSVVVFLKELGEKDGVSLFRRAR